jgi:hypothetical protein
MRYYGILWDIMGYYGILWDIMGYYGILWDIMSTSSGLGAQINMKKLYEK